MCIRDSKDMGPIGQVTEGGETASPKQKSEIFSIDANYDLTQTITVGGKYAFRKGSVSLGRDSDTYVSSDTHLAVLRADWRVVKEWDALIEGHYPVSYTHLDVYKRQAVPRHGWATWCDWA